MLYKGFSEEALSIKDHDHASHNLKRETTGAALLRLAKLGEKLQVKAPADLSSRIDDYLYEDK
jgi:hypothetical protein